MKRLPQHDSGMVYNFHHEHEQVDKYRSIVKQKHPFLLCVTLKWYKKEGLKMMAIGQGNLEKI